MQPYRCLRQPARRTILDRGPPDHKKEKAVRLMHSIAPQLKESTRVHMSLPQMTCHFKDLSPLHLTCHDSPSSTPVLSPSCSVRAPMRFEQRQPQVVHRRLARIAEVPARLQRAAALAGQQDRQVGVRVPVAVVDAAAVGDHAVVQQRARAFLDRLQLAEQVSELLDVECG